MPNPVRNVLFSVVTDDLNRSVELYSKALNLPMRPLSNPIAMFPLDPMGAVEFQVCLREAAPDLLRLDFTSEQTAGLVIGLKFPTEDDLTAAADAAVRVGAQLTEQSAGDSRTLRDFNGIYWSLTLKQ